MYVAKFVNSITLASLLLITILILSTCAGDSEKEEQDTPNLDGDALDYGDAEWDRAPLNVPGGEGDASSFPDWGDEPDGDSPDGDYWTDPDGDNEQADDDCPEVAACQAPAWCADDSTILVCSIQSDPDRPECLAQTLDPVTCEDTTICLEPDGDADFEVNCYSPDGDADHAEDTEDAENIESADDESAEREGESLRARPLDAQATQCPDIPEPVILYMSNDDSNSMASPILCRAKILAGHTVWPDEVRIHEFLNYYDLSYENPENKPVSVAMQMRRSNADTGEFTLLLSAQGRRVTPSARRPLNLVFSLDISGSMSGEPIQRVRDILAAIASILDKGDVISVVKWSNEPSVPLESYKVQQNNDPVLLDLAASLETGGSTDLHGGLVRAYQLAQDNYSANRINRVIMISDGGANAGVTDINIIAEAAADENGEGIYMVGIGVDDSPTSYNDYLMNEVTDAGKGAYVYIDTAEEAHRIFGDGTRFLSIAEVIARDVRMELTMPWYFGMKEFHGEEYSENPEEVEPQHLAPNDAMSYHQIIKACDPTLIHPDHIIEAEVTFKDPITRTEVSEKHQMTIGDLVTANASQLYKSDAIVSYAQSLIVIGYLVSTEEYIGAYETALGMSGWLEQAASELEDAEIAEITQLMQFYTEILADYLPADSQLSGN